MKQDRLGVLALRNEVMAAARYVHPALLDACVHSVGCLCPHTYQPDGTLVRDGVLALGCPVHDPDAGEGNDA